MNRYRTTLTDHTSTSAEGQELRVLRQSKRSLETSWKKRCQTVSLCLAADVTRRGHPILQIIPSKAHRIHEPSRIQANKSGRTRAWTFKAAFSSKQSVGIPQRLYGQNNAPKRVDMELLASHRTGGHTITQKLRCEASRDRLTEPQISHWSCDLKTWLDVLYSFEPESAVASATAQILKLAWGFVRLT